MIKSRIPFGRGPHTIWIIPAISAIVLFYTMGIIMDWPYWLRGVEWVWSRQIPPFVWTRFIWLMMTAVIWLTSAIFLVKHQTVWPRTKTALFLVGAVLFALLAQWSISLQHWPQPLALPFMNTTSIHGFFRESVRIEDPVVFLRSHVQQMPDYRSVHLQTQPPGWPLAFWGVTQLGERFPQFAAPVGHFLGRFDCTSSLIARLTPAQIAATTLQLTILLWSALAVLPLYKLAHRLFSAHTARLAVLVYTLLPGMLVFQARFDMLYAVVTIVALWLAWRVGEDGRLSHTLLLAGLLVSLSLVGFGPLAIIGLVNAFMLAAIWINRQSPQGVGRWLRLNAIILGLFILTWGSIWWVWDLSWWEMFRTSQEIHAQVRGSNPVWPLFNLYDFGIFLGFPLLIWAVAGGWYAVRRRLHGQAEPGDALSLSWLLFLIAFNLTGLVRAETGRIWLFLTIPGLIIGVAALVQWQAKNEISHSVLVFMLSLFAMQAIVTGYFLGGRGPLPETVPIQWQPPAQAIPTPYQLGETMALEGYEISAEADQLRVALYWRVLARVQTDDYSTFVHILDADSNIIGQSDGPPTGGVLPSWCWVNREVIEDVRTISVNEGGKRPYTLGVGLYEWRTGTRLPVTPPVANEIIMLNFKNFSLLDHKQSK